MAGGGSATMNGLTLTRHGTAPLPWDGSAPMNGHSEEQRIWIEGTPYVQLRLYRLNLDSFRETFSVLVFQLRSSRDAPSLKKARA